MSRRAALAALAVYAALSIAFFGIPVLPRLRTSFIGSYIGTDPSAYMWFLSWWPYAVLHGLNPFRPEIVWAPTGYNLAWSASVPGLALLVAPITLAFGPVVAYNVVNLCSPVVSAWAMFLLGRRLAGAFWPSLVGGYVYGFSAYMLGHLQGHLNMTPAFVPPLAALLVLARIEGRVAARWFVAGLTALLVFQFTLFTEGFATLTLFGGLAAGLALVMLPEVRRALWRASGLVVVAYAIAGVLLLPYFYHLFAFGFPREQLHEMEPYSTDLLNLVVPTPLHYFHRAFFDVSKLFTGNWSENVAYLGLPLVTILWLYARDHGRTRGARWALITLGAICLASMGPRLHVAGASTITLPWSFALDLPLINHAATGRFMLYAVLIVAAIVAVWLTRGASHWTLRWTLAALVVVSLLPNVWYWPLRTSWFSKVDTPAFFSKGMYRQYLQPGENTLVLPYAERGNSALWQAQTGMYYRMAGGYVGIAAPEFLRWPVVYTLYSGGLMPNHGPQLRAFLEAHDVRAVIVRDGAEGPWAELFKTLAVEPVRAGGVTLYRVPGLDGPSRPISRRQMDRNASLAEVASLVVAADDYQHAGLPLEKLTPAAVETLGVIPPYWGVPASPVPMGHLQTAGGLWLGPWEDRKTLVGITGSSAGLGPVAARYGRHAEQMYFPYPQPVPAGRMPEGQGALVMVFTREGLSRARAETTRILGD